ncbi:MAG: hypothetical protein CVV42_19295 [Candidatus Riflebacteria bacterium HGW-Riflebacteria-2]|jgi:hypothetical protein|nr:MAG: hypothetical protein CVV42_19295 [Candidatus Riflebacteria bacterium HGW-Riflebacteria-2]
MKNILAYLVLFSFFSIVTATQLRAEVKTLAELNTTFKSMAHHAGHLYVLTKEDSIIKISVSDAKQTVIKFTNPTSSHFTDLSVLNGKIYLCQFAGPDIFILDESKADKGLTQISCKNVGRITGISASSDGLIVKDDENNILQANSKGETRNIGKNIQFISDGQPLISAGKSAPGKWQISLGAAKYYYAFTPEDPVVQLIPVGTNPQKGVVFLETAGDGTFNSKFYLTCMKKEKFERVLELTPAQLFGASIAAMGNSGEVYRARKSSDSDTVVIEQIY